MGSESETFNSPQILKNFGSETFDSSQLLMHFDTAEHFLPADSYLITVKSLNNILNEINKRLFEGRLDCELLVFPHENGGFLSINGLKITGIKKAAKNTIITLGVLGGLVSFTETDTFKGAVHGITGKEMQHYETSKNIGELIHDLIIGIYKVENEDLKRKIPLEVNLDKAIKAKSDFYQMCWNSELIKAIGFDNTYNFSVPRNRFLYHISKDIIRPVESDFHIYDAVLVSPVNVPKDTKWVLEDRVTKTKISAHMRDKSFRAGLLNGKYPLKETKDDDVLTILVEYEKQERNGELEVKNTCIKTVYKFNNEDITPIPDDLPKGTKFKQQEHRPMDKYWGENDELR